MIVAMHFYMTLPIGKISATSQILSSWQITDVQVYMVKNPKRRQTLMSMSM